MVLMLGLHGAQHLGGMLLQNFDQGLSFAVHALDARHALSGLVPKEVNIAHQPQALEEENLLLRVTLFLGQHHVAELGGHDLRKFQSALGHVAFDLLQGL